MPYLQFRDKRVTLTPADQTVGAFDGAALCLPGDDRTARALVRIAPDGTGVVVRGGPDAVVYVNGVQLGVEPSPLLHGDKVEVGGQQLHYGDDAKGGNTQFISAASFAEKVKAASAAPKKPTEATGGRLVSLVDGREYQVPDLGVTFGREIGNDIVVAATEVSRRHAQIAPGEGGYVLSDLSTNGVLVNGVRVSQRQTLGRGDVITIGGEEFRFYADKSKEPAASAPPSAPEPAPAAAPVAESAPTPPRPLVVESAMDAAAFAQPVAPASPAPSAPARTPLATLEVINEGPMKGTTFHLYTPLTNVGRGAHNDISIADESMSDSHAKILRKDGHWHVADQGSTNGTYVAGRRVQGEQQLVGAPDLRFGNIKVTFRPTAAGQDAGSGTKAIAAVNVDQARRMSTAAKPAAAPTPPKPADKPIKIREAGAREQKKGCAAMMAFIFALGAVGAGMVVVLFTVRG